MSLESVKTHFKQWNRENDVMAFETSSATVEQAAETIDVSPARIAKTLSFRGEGDHAMLIAAAGDATIDNKKFGIRLASKPECFPRVKTGHEIGGVCPFGMAHDLDVYLDESMVRFETVFPACGSKNSAIELTLEELSEFSFAKEWIAVCKA
ncbi:YbaK/EbsC family protein [Bacillus atrophaeus]|uniref:YbaK/EbsC family protein n=1 Tax=Bacillus atrophaeus TaxID=1452 RepID=UPI00240E5755|nr:YbaK/EbsC family protein [Bacillus atrophaeus]